MLTPEQQQLFSSVLTGLGPTVTESLGGLLQPQTPEAMEATFQKGFVAPAMQTFQQKTIPGIQQAFSDVNASSSSALNQALAQGATDLSTSLGSQYGQFQQGQQTQLLQALSQFMPLLTGQTFAPLISEQQGILGPAIKAAGQAGSAAATAMSSKHVKANIEDYHKGLDYLKKMAVKQFDYIEEVGGKKNKVGLIAEEIPKELTESKDGILHVDLYGLIGLLINSVQELDNKIENFKEAVCQPL